MGCLDDGPKILWRERRSKYGTVYYRPQWEKYRRKDGSVGYRAKRYWPEWEPLERALEGELLGSLHEERVRCGKPTCRCASGRRKDMHTAFYRRWLDEDEDKQRKEYVKRKDVEAVRAAIQRRRDRLAEEREEREEEMGRGKYSWKARNAEPSQGAPSKAP
jgi:hypothetical protein